MKNGRPKSKSEIEGARRQAQGEYRKLLEFAPDAMVIVNREGKIILANSRMEKLFGYTEEDLLGQPVEDLVPARYRGKHRKARADYYKNLRVRPMGAGLDLYGVRKDGSEFPVEISLNPLKTENGVLIVSAIRDVTDRKSVEEELRRAHEELEVRVEERTAELSQANTSLEEEIAERRRTERALKANARRQAVVAQLGQRALSGANLSLLMNEAVALVAETLGVEYCKVLELRPDRKGLLLRAGVGWKEGLVGREIVSLGTNSQAGYALQSNDPVVVEELSAEKRFSGPPLLEDHGVVGGVCVIITGQDRPFGVLGAHTTRRREFSKDEVHFLQAVANVLAEAIQRKRAEEALKRERNFVSTVLNTTGALVVVLDTEGRIVRFNRACELTTGYSADEVEGKSLWDLFILPEELDKVKSLFKDLCAGRFPNQGKNYWVTKDGNWRMIAWSNTALLNDEGDVEYLIGTGIDLTEQFVLEQRIIRAEQLALIGELAAGLAHEVKNPLAGIKAAIEIVMEGLPEGDPHLPVLGQVLDETMRVNSTVSKLLDYARPHSPSPTQIDLNDLVKRVLASAQLQLNTDGVALEFRPAEELPVVVVDPDDMQKVILNLLLNAIQAVKGKGRVVAKTSVEAGSAYVKLSIADTGKGIPPENLEKIFRPFFTTKKKGTGLGLANCKRIISSYGGTISVESELGKGSVFAITIPTQPVA